MKDFSVVGRRLRLFRNFAFVPLAFGIFLGVTGVASYMDHGPPTRWVFKPTPAGGHQEAIPQGDPEYFSVLRSRDSQLMYLLLWASGFLAIGALFYGRSRRAPCKEVLLLAQERRGVLSLPEVSTTLDIDPRLAASALRTLQKLHIATPCWQEIRKNLWEFPDYMSLPLSESIQLAKTKGGSLTLSDLVAAGHSADTARQTIDALSEMGLAQQNPAITTPAMIVATQ